MNPTTQLLTFFGMKSSTSEYVKMVIQDRVEAAGIDLQIEEIQNPEAFLRYSLTSLPSIKIGEEIRSMEESDPVAFARETSQWILEKSDYGSLKQIIVPIDFSAAAQNALEYALKLSEKLGAYITILYVDRPESKVSNNGEINPDLSEWKKEMLDNVIQKVNALSTCNDETATPLLRKAFKVGFAADVILEEAAAKPDSIVIMGTTGNSGKLKKYLGSVSTKVAQNCKSPLILVPPTSFNRKIDKIAYCATDEVLDVSVLDELLIIARANMADLHVIHFTTPRDTYDEKEYLNILSRKYPNERIQYNQIKGKINSELLNEYAINNDIDLIALSTKNRIRLEKIFHKSMTYHMSFMSKHPLLILHQK